MSQGAGGIVSMIHFHLEHGGDSEWTVKVGSADSQHP